MRADCADRTIVSGSGDAPFGHWPLPQRMSWFKRKASIVSSFRPGNLEG
jgi:hypothetical protein